MNFILVTSATSTLLNANEIASRIMSEKLAACVHVSPITSHYFWKGKIENQPEFLISIKTIMPAFEKLEACIKSTHNYELPEISFTQITGGSKEYLNWILEAVETL